jgi:NADH-quinone oxidoreductase subunit N
MPLSSNILTLLPEYILVVAGVLVMLAEPFFKDDDSRAPLGWLAIIGTAASGAAAFYQSRFVAGNGALHAFSGTMVADNFSVFFHLLIAATVLVTLLGSMDYFRGHATHAGEYFALVLFGATGMMLMTSANELLMVFIGLEISSISTYILAGFRKGKITASESAIKYFLLGSFATAFFLYGIALTFGATGTTSIPAIAAGIAVTRTPMLALTAIAMIVIGLGFKVSAAPFHVWTPDVYQGAPAPVVGLMSTAPKAAAFAVLLRVLLTGFPAYEARWALMLWGIAALSMTIGNLGALLQKDVKRMLAYSSIAHAGYLLVAFSSLPSDAVSNAAFYIAAYSAMNVGAFLVLTQVSGFSEETRSRKDFAGLAKSRPVMAALLSFFLLSMIGIPFTAGFFAKFYVFAGAFHAGHTALVIIGLANSGVACFYYLRLILSLYGEPDADRVAEPAYRRVSISASIALAACAVAVLLLGVMPGKIVAHAGRAAVAIAEKTATPVTLPNIPCGMQDSKCQETR